MELELQGSMELGLQECMELGLHEEIFGAGALRMYGAWAPRGNPAKSTPVLRLLPTASESK